MTAINRHVSTRRPSLCAHHVPGLCVHCRVQRYVLIQTGNQWWPRATVCWRRVGRGRNGNVRRNKRDDARRTIWLPGVRINGRITMTKLVSVRILSSVKVHQLFCHAYRQGPPLWRTYIHTCRSSTTLATTTLWPPNTRAGRFVRFWVSGWAKFPTIWDSLPVTPMNRRAKFDAESFMLYPRRRNSYPYKYINKHTNKQ